MGKTSKPVRILVLDEDLFGSDEVQALMLKGHPIALAGDNPFHTLPDYDLILGRRAWYCDMKHIKYLEKIIIPSARTRIDYREKEKKK